MEHIPAYIIKSKLPIWAGCSAFRDISNLQHPRKPSTKLANWEEQRHVQMEVNYI